MPFRTGNDGGVGRRAELAVRTIEFNASGSPEKGAEITDQFIVADALENEGCAGIVAIFRAPVVGRGIEFGSDRARPNQGIRWCPQPSLNGYPSLIVLIAYSSIFRTRTARRTD